MGLAGNKVKANMPLSRRDILLFAGSSPHFGACGVLHNLGHKETSPTKPTQQWPCPKTRAGIVTDRRCWGDKNNRVPCKRWIVGQLNVRPILSWCNFAMILPTSRPNRANTKHFYHGLGGAAGTPTPFHFHASASDSTCFDVKGRQLLRLAPPRSLSVAQ